MKPLLVFYSDFTTSGGAVSALCGVAKTVDASLEIYTGTHDIPPFDTWSASYRLWQAIPYWPAGTVFVCCVAAPGAPVGCVAHTQNGAYIMCADGACLTHAAKITGIRAARQIDAAQNCLPGAKSAHAFYARDVLAYTAARLACGQISFDDVGPVLAAEEIPTHPLSRPDISKGYVRGTLEMNDPPFGNLWSDILADSFEAAGFAPGDTVLVRVLKGAQEITRFEAPYRHTPAPQGGPVVFVNGLSSIAIGLSGGNMAKSYGISFGGDWHIEFMRGGEKINAAKGNGPCP